MIYRALAYWADGVKLSRHPVMPDELASSPRDGWRPLIAIADACGEAIGEIARNAAVAISGGYGTNPKVRLLADILRVFKNDDRLAPELKNLADLPVHLAINSRLQLSTDTLLSNLHGLNPLWAAWTGLDGKKPPRPLTANDLI